MRFAMLVKIGVLLFGVLLKTVGVSSVPWLSLATTAFDATEMNNNTSIRCNNTNLSNSSSNSRDQRGCTVAEDDHRQHLLCDGLSNRQQRRLCLLYPKYIDAVRMAAMASISECQFQLRHSLWNCPIVDRHSVFGNIANSGTKESAFIHSISSASVAHAVTRGCSSGQIPGCSCDNSRHGPSQRIDFRWQGCSDDIEHGVAFARSFTDIKERNGNKNERRDISRLILHNNNAGRKTFETQSVIRCKCHGVSGSCEIRTCWRNTADFRRVGAVLKDRYDNAVKVKPQRLHRILAAEGHLSKDHLDLVYSKQSPSFCDRDPKRGIMGTRGRSCNKNSTGSDGCDVMCCGRGFLVRQSMVMEQCNCKYHHCCYIKCDVCQRLAEEYICR